MGFNVSFWTNFLPVSIIPAEFDSILLCSLSDTIFILCHSLILLSVDLCSPHVKNKMTKREFVKNLRGVVDDASYDFIGDLYDNIFLEGHVAVHPGKCSKLPFRYERPYANVLLQA